MEKGEILLGRYRLIKRIGSGGMSIVWLAEDQNLGREVALKIMRHDLLHDPDQRVRFEREAELAARLSDPHIVSVWERGELEGQRPFMAMEYVDGETLREKLESGVSAEELHWLFDQILAGVAAAHRSGIVHRDLKPQNILLSRDGEVKLADFGVAISEENDLDLTKEGTVIGTARYLSPEQAHGEPATRRSDLYAVGIMLYEAWTGRTPWEGENMVSILAQQATSAPPPPSRFNSTVSPEIDQLVLKAIAYRPEDRFSSAAEFRFALGHPGLFRKKRQRSRRRRLLWLLPLLLVTLGAAFLLQPTDSKETVPLLRGLDLIEARAMLADLGIPAEINWTSSRKEAGTVLRQDPRAGSEIAAGDEILLDVSSGPGQIKVPRLQGLPLSTAREALGKLGLESRVRYQNSKKDQGRVLGSSPGAGLPLEAGDTVTIRVSSGPEVLRVGDLFGKTLSQAVGELDGLGIEYSYSYVSSDYPADTVIGQIPQPGQPISGTVTLQVSSGPETGPVFAPELVGLLLGQARYQLEDLGLGLVVRSRAISEDEEPGTVLKQKPEAGAEVPGSTVWIVVGERP